MDGVSIPIDLAAEITGALHPVSSPTATFQGDEDNAGLQSCFDVTGLAVSSIGAACAELAALSSAASAQDLLLSRRLASLWFDMTIRPQEWQMPPVWDAIAGLYRAKDHWIRLHTNAPLHRESALKVLDCDAQRDAVARRVADWAAEDLEQAIVANGGCAALLRSMAQWDAHPQGKAVASEPLIAWTPTQQGAPIVASSSSDLPLRGLRVLDCTRVLAGPVCTRLLAGFGAEVLRIDPPAWAEANVEPEVTLGKRLATLDLREPPDKARFEALLAKSDLFIHGYRPGALDDLGLGANRRLELNPKLIDVSLSAYGHNGPWAQRRGYDSLVQMSTGIAHEGMLRGDKETPTPLPVQALDHATGYLMAAAALRALRVVRESGTVLSARLSLARTAELLKQTSLSTPPEAFASEGSGDFAPGFESTYWGPARRIRFPLVSGLAAPKWPLPARPLHSDMPQWTD
ncbi:CoA transferase [Congregibacter variabilis]|uniref:CoA transferase n=1 Tax=Congregibacter variabilis TaxID=3081200 RepID=A0ABZ0I316_9GAMM|nr:CoA transferase [Congregibacter sp. IMCC43200]